ncbi:MAG: TrmJ/YjtD family RNA methyltransferase [Thermoanaerobaculia bacterium]|nr:TrmJ/YjtD family RNA methyltransferase [Thermoanaerobaculia bacterium]
MSDRDAQRSSPASAAVVLVRPQEEGNVGAAARAMANMGLERLLLVEPAPALGRTARAFAVGAGRILAGVERYDRLTDAVAPFQRLVGTTSSRQRALDQRVVTARELPQLLAADEPHTATAILFGPEASGLTRDELALCDPVVVIPCAPVQPTLNLAQAVLLVAYELSLASPSPAPGSPAPPPADQRASVEAIGRLLRHADELLRATGFDRDDTYHGVLRDLRQLAARAAPTEREVQILHGICRRTLGTLAALTSEHPGRDEGHSLPPDGAEERERSAE